MKISMEELELYNDTKSYPIETLLSWAGYKTEKEFEDSSDLPFTRVNLIISNYEDILENLKLLGENKTSKKLTLNGLKGLIRNIIKEEYNQSNEQNQISEFNLNESPGDTVFIMNIAKDKGIKSFNSFDEIIKFMKENVVGQYNITKTYKSDVDFILNNYEKFLEETEKLKTSRDTLKGFAKNDIGLSDEEMSQFDLD